MTTIRPFTCDDMFYFNEYISHADLYCDHSIKKVSRYTMGVTRAGSVTETENRGFLTTETEVGIATTEKTREPKKNYRNFGLVWYSSFICEMCLSPCHDIVIVSLSHSVL